MLLCETLCVCTSTSLSSCITLSTDDSSIVLACSMIASYPAGYFSFTEPVYEALLITLARNFKHCYSK